MAKTITQGGTTLTFTYGADRARFKQVNGSKTTLYVGGVFEKETVGSTVTYTHYVGGDGSSAVAIYKAIDSTTDSELTRYLHRDHLGSVSTVTNSGGTVEEQLSFDAWGQRRYDDWTAGVPAGPFETTRGFTGHEMLDDVGIIHMNGRIYDPDTGRFLSADPTMQFPDNPQNFNRYSYVMNNPLSFTDPSGYGIVGAIQSVINGFWNTLGKVMKVPIIRTALSIGVFFIPGINMVAAGYLSGMIASGGDVKTGVISALTAGFAEYIHGAEILSNFGDLANAAEVAANGIVNGITSEINGGNFFGGFVSAALPHLVGTTKFVQGLDKAGQFITRTITGGLSAELGGGKFKNGAVTAAMVFAAGMASEAYDKKQAYQFMVDAGKQLEAEGAYSIGPNSMAVNWADLGVATVDFGVSTVGATFGVLAMMGAVPIGGLAPPLAPWAFAAGAGAAGWAIPGMYNSGVAMIDAIKNTSSQGLFETIGSGFGANRAGKTADILIGLRPMAAGTFVMRNAIEAYESGSTIYNLGKEFRK